MNPIKTGSVIEIGDVHYLVVEKVEEPVFQILILGSCRLLPNTFNDRAELYAWILEQHTKYCLKKRSDENEKTNN